jgi:hypothetical protein
MTHAFFSVSSPGKQMNGFPYGIHQRPTDRVFNRFFRRGGSAWRVAHYACSSQTRKLLRRGLFEEGLCGGLGESAAGYAPVW